MRFYKITTNYNQDKINEVIMSMTSSEVDYVIKIYGQLSMVEYTDENGFECMFAILDNYLIEKLNDIYKKYSLNFNVIDITKDIIFDEPIRTKYKTYSGKSANKAIQELIKEFKNNWVSKDDILDKILEKGINSLTKLDLKILKS
jgi:hypothetical protein